MSKKQAKARSLDIGEPPKNVNPVVGGAKQPIGKHQQKVHGGKAPLIDDEGVHVASTVRIAVRSSDSGKFQP